MKEMMLFFSEKQAFQAASLPSYRRKDGKVIEVTIALDPEDSWETIHQYRRGYPDAKYMGIGVYECGGFTVREQYQRRLW